MQNIRNIAIIAHVDHGKTTLVDKMLLAGNLFRENQNAGELILDNNDLERERGITILSKNVSINYKDTKINIIDTPGHADFGGEVERVLNMADGCLLLVDAFEGPMPQTRFVLQKAIQMGLKPVVVINKVDKPNCRPDEVQEMVFDLMFNLDATEDQLDFPTIYGSAKNGWMSTDWSKPTDNITPLLDTILEHIPAPTTYEGEPQMLITSLDYSNYVGRIAVGRVHRGTIREGMEIGLCKRDGSVVRQRVKELHTFEGMGRKKVSEVASGDICAIVGLDNFEIGDTVTTVDNPEPLPRIAIDEPTMSMTFTINDSPFFGKDGKYVTSRHIQDRLTRELDKNLALRVERTEREDAWNVFGRGVLHLSVLIETMRREGYELQVGQPQVIVKEIDGVKCEPVEMLTINVTEEYASKMIDLVTRRKGEMLSMTSQADRVHMEFQIPSVLSGTYDICAVVLPRTVYNATDRNFRPCKFKASIGYETVDGIEQSFDFEDEVKNDPYRVDTVKIGTFTIPVCSYGQPNAKVHLTLECSISRMESGRYNREMYLDCLYFKPNREE